ncbi:MAG: hypothetical protein KDE27_27540, partial [Planctomycetes bacterium]|nr:hypothetical protein [Planctomycetota bacterium]
LDARRGTPDAGNVDQYLWPRGDAAKRAIHAVSTAVAVDELGPEVERLLHANGRAGQKKVGHPLSLHLYDAAEPAAVECDVVADGAPIAGWLVRGGGSNGRTSAPGLWVFYPAEPLPRGVDIVAKWRWDEQRDEVTFKAQ